MRQRRAFLVCLFLAVAPLLALVAEPINLVGKCEEIPVVNLPMGLRQPNWCGSKGEGSCVHASFIMLLRWQGHYALADWWKVNNGNGEWPHTMEDKLERAGVKFAATYDGDVDFLEWACRTRRGCAISTGVVVYGDHMVCLVHLDSQWAGILDNNNIGEIKWVRRSDFIMDWKLSGGWAVTPVYSPVPPLPR